jgi:hypothetical protein
MHANIESDASTIINIRFVVVFIFTSKNIIILTYLAEKFKCLIVSNVLNPLKNLQFIAKIDMLKIYRRHKYEKRIRNY